MIKQSNEPIRKSPHGCKIGAESHMLLWLSRVDALSKLAGGKFVAKDGAELCSSSEEHFLGKEKQVALQRLPNLTKSAQNLICCYGSGGSTR